jgi:hypothetical protein
MPEVENTNIQMQIEIKIEFEMPETNEVPSH